MSMLSCAMDVVHENSVSAIHVLQANFYRQQNLMFYISTLFDPRYAFLFFSPVIFSLDRFTGRKIMWVAVIAEWSNMLLKWILHGERPYWWIHETDIYNNTKIPFVKQFEITCETGPGSPSGHAMVTAAIWYIIVEAFLRQRGTLTKRSLMNRFIWAIYTIILCTVSLSRVYIAAHFPHQCLLGAIIGVAVAIIVTHLDTDKYTQIEYIIGTFGLLLSAMATYSVLRFAFGMNPMWSVDRAIKWCAKQEYVHLDTTPFFSMMRYAGFFLGMGFGLHSPLYEIASKTRFTGTMRIASAVLALSACKISEYISLPMSNMYVFYSLAFVLNSLLPYIFIAIIPFTIASIKSFIEPAPPVDKKVK